MKHHNTPFRLSNDEITDILAMLRGYLIIPLMWVGYLMDKGVKL
jgi:hypothetical protein